MKNWKTTLSGIAAIAFYAVAYFWPEYKEFCLGLQAVLISAGMIAAKDSNVTGGTKQQ